jgi:uncharacterized protein YjbI with pentapeptide repeats
MADEEQLGILKQGAEAWNAWRQQAVNATIDLSRADLRWANLRRGGLNSASLDGADLSRADLRWANLIDTYLPLADLSDADLRWAGLSSSCLRGANLSQADLSRTDLSRADLGRANLRGACLLSADLSGAGLREANLREADLSDALLGRADLSQADLRQADLSQADLREAQFWETIVSNVDLSTCKNLDTIRHGGPSPIDIRTLQLSGQLPLAFLRGVGLPDNLIDYLPSLLGRAIQHYSCFISYSSKDEDFANRLHADLQNKGVRCWFAPDDMKIGAKIRDTIDDAIRLRDKVLLVLSEASIASDWVEDEVDKAFEEERQRGGVVLFPVRVDDGVMETKEAWASKLRRSRNIGDFRGWKDHDAYQKALQRVLRDLQIEPAPDAA